jgi:hypothetical protein
MRLHGTFRIPRLNLQAYKSVLQEELGRAITQAALEWLGATTALIPVWSGASIATFQPLASEVGFQLASLANIRAFKNRIPLGLQNAEGDVQTDVDAGQFTFTYRTTLAHLIYNEFNNANISPDPTLFAGLITPGPYEFQRHGQQAFDRFASTVRLPDPTKNLTVKTVRVR